MYETHWVFLKAFEFHFNKNGFYIFDSWKAVEKNNCAIGKIKLKSKPTT